eukprot:8805446-Lingulodinium_polyedra.AAC.1
MARDTAGFYSLLRGLAPWKPRRPRVLRLKDGSMARSPAEVAARWKEHHSSVFGGRESTFEQLELQADLRCWGQGYLEEAEHEPSLQLVSDAIQRLPEGKAVG